MNRYPKKVQAKKVQHNAEASSIKSVFGALLNEYHLEDKFREKHLIASWSKVMGKPIALRTDRLYFRDKKLFVHLNSDPLKSELDHSKGKVLEILNREFGEGLVKDVVFL